MLIENIGSGGAQISTGLSMPLAIGMGLMLEVDALMPIGGYVRWGKQGRCGLMFSKLLPIAAAEDIADRCHLHPAWLVEVKSAHAALAGAATTATAAAIVSIFMQHLLNAGHLFPPTFRCAFVSAMFKP